MKRIILLVAAMLAGIGGVLGQEFPMELVWAVPLDDQATSLGSVWSENGVSVLVGTASQLIFVRDGDIVWRSPEIGNVMASSMVDFGDGPEFIAATPSNDHGIVHRFRGDGFREYSTGIYGWGRPQGWQRSGYDYQARWIGKMHESELDSTKSIILWCWKNEVLNYEGFGSDWWGGEIHQFSLAEMSAMEFDNEIGQGPLTLLRSNVRGEDRQDYILAGNNFLTEYNAIGSQSSRYSTVSICDANWNEIESFMLTYSGGSEYAPIKEVGLSGATIYETDDSERLVVAMVDTIGRCFKVYSLPEMDLISRHAINAYHNPIGIVSNQYEEDYLIAMHGSGEIRVYALPNFELVSIEGFTRNRVKGVKLIDFNNNGSTELLVLAGDTLSLFSVGDLDVQYDSVIRTSTFLLTSFPNPFNSSTTITYDVSRPGFVRLGVYDVAGRKVGTVREGWREAGRYREVWDGGSLANGQYVIILNGEFLTAQPVTLVK